jgi:hypothetical protein
MNANENGNVTAIEGVVEPTSRSVGSQEPGVAPAFDLAQLRLSQDFAASIGVKKAILTVPVKKPHRQWFVRVRPEEQWRLQTGVIELNEEREVYLVDRSLWEDLSEHITPKILVTAINRQNVLFLWPIRFPGGDGRIDAWNRSALEAAELAMKSWVSVRANMALGAYEVFEATGNFGEPNWPDLTFEKIVEVAFKDRFIRTTDHPVLRKLRGEV